METGEAVMMRASLFLLYSGGYSVITTGYAHMCVHPCVRTYVCACMSVWVCVHVCAHVCMNVHMCVCVCLGVCLRSTEGKDPVGDNKFSCESNPPGYKVEACN